MLNKIFFITFIGFAMLASSCKEEKKETNLTTPLSQNKLTRLEQQQAVYDMEQKTIKNKNTPFDEAAALSMVNMYSNYVENFPNDSTINPQYLFKCAQLQTTLKLTDQAIKNIDELITRYPNAPETANAYYLKAFIYDTLKKDPEAAKKAYLDFINKYPHHPLTESAKANLAVAGKSEEELLNFIKSKNK